MVWDLDNTLWDGVLLEDSSVRLKDDIPQIIETLDSRGILQSIASKNNHQDAMNKLAEFGLQDYFLYPQIHWNSKSSSIGDIAKMINIGTDAIAFVDDSPVELDEVAFSLPEVLCIHADKTNQILNMPCMIPRFMTQDQKRRRHMYLASIQRDEAEKEFSGPTEDFLASLDMVLDIFPAAQDDLQRAEELTVRTNQLNATGYTFSYDELNLFRSSSRHMLLMAKLEDCYGTYGHIGLALLECEADRWVLKLLLMSCRVMSRGVGTVLLNHIINLALDSNVKLYAEFIPTDRNRMMSITYGFAGFEEIEQRKEMTLLKHPLKTRQPFPDYMQVNIGY